MDSNLDTLAMAAVAGCLVVPIFVVALMRANFPKATGAVRRARFRAVSLFVGLAAIAATIAYPRDLTFVKNQTIVIAVITAAFCLLAGAISDDEKTEGP